MKATAEVILILFSIAALAGARIGQPRPEATLDEDASAALNALFQRSPSPSRSPRSPRACWYFRTFDRLAVLVGVHPQGRMLATRSSSHYRIDGVIAGLEAGGQSYAYEVFFMSDKAWRAAQRARLQRRRLSQHRLRRRGLAKEFTTTTPRPSLRLRVQPEGLIGASCCRA